MKMVSGENIVKYRCKCVYDKNKIFISPKILGPFPCHSNLMLRFFNLDNKAHKKHFYCFFYSPVNLSKSVATGLNQIQLVSVLEADERFRNTISVRLTISCSYYCAVLRAIKNDKIDHYRS